MYFPFPSIFWRFMLCCLCLQTPTFINRELVDRGYAMWCEGEGDKTTASEAEEKCEDKDEEKDSTDKESEQ